MSIQFLKPNSDNTVEFLGKTWEIPYSAKKEADGTIECVSGRGMCGTWVNIGGVRVRNKNTVLREKMLKALKDNE